MARRVWLVVIGVSLILAMAAFAGSLLTPRHNVIIFVADGLRYDAVNPLDAPAMSRVRAEGVDFANSHSLLPTITTPNASAIATGHGIGDTGDFANIAWLGPQALKAAFLSLTAPFEDDAVQAEANARFAGNYLGEETLLHLLHRQGWQTAAIGKDGPTAIQAVTAHDGKTTLVIDEESGTAAGFAMPAWFRPAIAAAGLEWPMPDRGLNGYAGTSIMPGVRVANTEQQDWQAQVAAKVILPHFKAQRRPFALVFWSLDPDGTQHSQGDSLNSLAPGINGPTTALAVHNADNDLAALRAALVTLGLDKTTDIVVTADHGFSTLSRQSATSPAAKGEYGDVPKGFLPPGFPALDLGRALGLKVSEPNGLEMNAMGHPRSGSAILGDPAHPSVVVGTNGGVDELWLPRAEGHRALAERIVAELTRQDYTAAIFVKGALGAIPGSLPLKAIGFDGSARTPEPDIVVSFRSYLAPGCTAKAALLCAAEVADNPLQQGQGIHGGFSRANTHNMMAAIGPDFRRGFVDPAPVSNADWAPTVAKALGVRLPSRGKLTGRVMTEAMRGGTPPQRARAETLRSAPAANGFVTALNVQRYAGKTYFDAASRTVGFKP